MFILYRQDPLTIQYLGPDTSSQIFRNHARKLAIKKVGIISNLEITFSMS
jgi:hypothetical protein